MNDPYGNAVARTGIWFETTSGTLSATRAETDRWGRASVDLVLGGRPGLVVVTAYAEDGTTVELNETCRSTQPTIVVARGDRQRAPPGSLLAPLVARVNDSLGRPVPDAVVAFELASGTGVLSSSSVATGRDGEASVTLTLGPRAGPVGVTASLDGDPAVTFTEIALVGPPAVLSRVSGDGQTGVAGSELAEPLVVRVADAWGNPVPDVPVSFAGTWGARLRLDIASTGADGSVCVRVKLPPPGFQGSKTALGLVSSFVLAAVGSVAFLGSRRRS